ncbi:hypothetical protein TWF281_010649 [Arthrobotrys megalospora]
MTTLRSHYDYTVGWICALPKEQTAAMLVLDAEHPDLITPYRDKNVYTLGSIGSHNIVITCLPISCYGTNQMAATAAHMAITFPSIKITLMVGIGAGVPSKVKLGDVVISTEWIQWDFGKASRGFELSSRHYYPPKELSAAMSKLKSQQNRHGTRIPQYLDEIKANNRYLSPEYTSVPGKETAADPRKARVHYGLIASGNQVIKNARKRDEISQSLRNQVLCIEMEAAGLVDCPAVIVRGICDYADETKNDDWQEYAAVLAAICAKELLRCVQPNHINNARPISDNIQQGLGTRLEQGHHSVGSLLSGISETPQHRDIDSRPPPSYYDIQNDYSNRSGPGTGVLDPAKSQNQHEAKEISLPQKITGQREKDNSQEGNLSRGMQLNNRVLNSPRDQSRRETKKSPHSPRAASTSYAGKLDALQNKISNKKQPETSASDLSEDESQLETEELPLFGDMFEIPADEHEDRSISTANLLKHQNRREIEKLPYSPKVTSNSYAEKLDVLKNKFPNKGQLETSASDLLVETDELTFFGGMFEIAAVEHEESSTPAPTPERRAEKGRNSTQQRDFSNRRKPEAQGRRERESKPYERAVNPSQDQNEIKQLPEISNKKAKTSAQRNNLSDRKQLKTTDERLLDELPFSPGILDSGGEGSTQGNLSKSSELQTGGRLPNSPEHQNQSEMNELPFFIGTSDDDDEDEKKPQQKGLSNRMELLKRREPETNKGISNSPEAQNKWETKQLPFSGWTTNITRMRTPRKEREKKG